MKQPEALRLADDLAIEALSSKATGAQPPINEQEPSDAQIALLDPWMRPAAAKELLTQVLALSRSPQPKELAQPPINEQEPVQRYSPDGNGGMEFDSLGAWVKFTSPPPIATQHERKPWVGPTHKEHMEIMTGTMTTSSRMAAVEDALRSKNT